MKNKIYNPYNLSIETVYRLVKGNNNENFLFQQNCFKINTSYKATITYLVSYISILRYKP